MSVTELQEPSRMSETPERSYQQRMVALERANRVRSYRADLKRKMKVGAGRSARDVLAGPLEEEHSMKVFELLLAIPRVGRVKASKWLGRARISHAKTVGGLTQRQRAELLAIMGRR